MNEEYMRELLFRINKLENRIAQTHFEMFFLVLGLGIVAIAMAVAFAVGAHFGLLAGILAFVAVVLVAGLGTYAVVSSLAGSDY
jgi:hypothetical protein